jgi:antibiotic biosynthesis monooxygenase (ABM) superfamily enzyme
MLMAVVLFVVRATITKDKEAAFNTWYNQEHVPQVLQYNGAVSGRRYKRVMGDDKYEYMAVYEFASEEVFSRFQQSDHLKALRAEYDKHFGSVSERVAQGWVQVFP